MTSQKAEIQALISGIDEVLSKNSPRLPWVMSNDAIQQRQILEQTRQYLASLQQQDADPLPADNSPALPEFSSMPGSPSPSESAQQVLQAVLQEMNYWRVNMLQPLRAEVDSLQRQREILTQEIRQLEAQRQQYGLPGQPSQQLLMEFLQSAMAQMQANLSGQVTQMIAGLSAQSAVQPALQSAADRNESQNLAALSPAERLAQLQNVQVQSDQLMLKLDSTLQIIFESLNRNVQTYQESLEQGLNRMHGLGQQGEAMFAFLVNRLAQQLGREASSFLQTPAPDWQPPTSSSLPPNPSSEASEFTVTDFLSQVPEPPRQSSTFTPAVPFDLSEEVLDIAELELSDSPLEANNLEALDLELSQLDLSAIPTESESGEALDLFVGDQPLPTTPTTLSAQASAEPPIWKFASPLTSELDSALDLLNQLSAEMQTGTTIESPMIELPEVNAAELASEELITTPDSLYDDAFYEGLRESAGTDSVSVSSISNSSDDATNITALTLEQEWFGGLDDPAAQPEIKQSAEPELLTGSAPQSLETFLLNNAAPAPAIPDTDLFAEFAVSEEPTATASSQIEEPVEMIASLEELIPEPLAHETAESLFPSQHSDLELKKDPPEEPLLIAEAPTEELSVDLGMTVAPEQSASVAPPSDSPESSEADADWDVLGNPSNEAESTASAPTVITIEGLEDLFGEVPDLLPPPDSAPGSEPFDSEKKKN